jgi:4-azaleucine resistance transporter AzlC
MIHRGIKDAVPIMLGFFPIAITFGILAKTAGVMQTDGLLMSIMVYAGASQFMAVSMIGAGIGTGSIILATFLMNFRHFIMSASIRGKMEGVHHRWYPLIGFYLTDEGFSVLSLKEDIGSPGNIVAFELACYVSWVSGTLVGYLVGQLFPLVLIQAMGIALYALFMALLIPACKQSFRAPVVAICAGIMNTLLVNSDLVGRSSSFMVSVIVVALLAVVAETLGKKEVVNES